VVWTSSDCWTSWLSVLVILSELGLDPSRFLPTQALHVSKGCMKMKESVHQIRSYDETLSHWLRSNNGILKPLIPTSKTGGRPRAVNIREVVNCTIFYYLGWRPWRWCPMTCAVPVYYYFHWRIAGLWQLNQTLRQKYTAGEKSNSVPLLLIADPDQNYWGSTGDKLRRWQTVKDHRVIN